MLTLPANSDRWDILFSKINDIERNMGQLTGVVADMKKQMDATKKVVDEVKTQIQKTGDAVNSESSLAGWKYYGRGGQRHYDDYIYKHGVTFPECVHLCEVKRIAESDGAAWNGMIYQVGEYGYGYCQCIKGDIGHVNGTDWVHFKVQ